MKKMKLLMLLLSLTLSSLAFSAETNSGSPSGATDKGAMVLKALNNPSNPTAKLLKAALTAGPSADLQILPESLVVNDLAENRYHVTFWVYTGSNPELAEVTIEEVLIENEQAYVFNFNVARLVRMKKYPGVSMGNR